MQLWSHHNHVQEVRIVVLVPSLLFPFYTVQSPSLENDATHNVQVLPIKLT